MALQSIYNECVKPLRFGENNLIICNRTSITADIKNISDKIAAVQHQNPPPMHLHQNVVYGVKKDDFWYRVILKVSIAGTNKSILTFLDCDGLRNAYKTGKLYTDIIRITDEELCAIPYGQDQNHDSCRKSI